MYEKKAIPCCFHPVFLALSLTCLNKFFFPNLRVFMGNPLTLHLRFFIKMLSLDAVAMIERAILGCFHPISLLFSVIYLKNDFLASFPLFAHAHGQSLDPSSTFFIKMLSLDAVATISSKRKLSRLFPPNFSTIFRHLPKK